MNEFKGILLFNPTIDHAIIIIGLLLGFILLILNFKNRNSFSRHLKDLEDIYKILADVERLPGIDRSLIFMTKDSGNKPMPGVPIYVTSLYEGPNTNEKHKYQNIRVDAEYVSMMLEAKKYKRLDLIVKEMPYGILQKIYMAENVTYSCIFFIHEDSKAFYYGSFASHSLESLPTEVDVGIDLAITKLQYIWHRPRNNWSFFW